MNRRFISVVICIMLLFTLIPLTAFAETGETIENLALGKMPAGSYLADFSDVTNLAPANNPNTWGMLTDGVYGNRDNWGDAATWLKMFRNIGRELVIDLGQINTVKSMSIGCGQRNDVGIRTPSFVNYYVSNDGSNYIYAGKAYPDVPLFIENTTPKTTDMDRKVYRLDKLADGTPMNIQARYVKVVFYVDVWVWADEIEIMGKKGIVDNAIIPLPAVDDSTPPVNKFPAKYSEESAQMADQFLLYTGPYATPEVTNWTREKVTQILAYPDEYGDIANWYFEDLLIMPIGNELNPSGKGVFATKADWEAFLDFIFQQDKQLDVINSAAKEINQKLGTNKKVGIDIAIPVPIADTRNFGDIKGDGSIISFDPNDFASQVSDPTSIEGRIQMFYLAMDNRIAAIKWFVDEAERRFKAKGYDNIELTSFYLHNESLNALKAEEVWAKAAGEYVKSKGYYYTWIPYLGTLSPIIWKETGFSTATFQPNYAFGGKKRGVVPAVADFARKYGLGIEMEYGYGSATPLLISRFSEYLNDGIFMGYMKDTYHNYYLNATSLNDSANSSDPVFKGLYDRIFDFTQEKYVPRFVLESLAPNLNDKSNIIVPVKILNASNFTSGSFSVLYDASKVNFKSSAVGAQIKGIGNYTATVITPGLIKVEYDISDPAKALYGDFDDAKDLTKGRAEIVKLYFSKRADVSDASITAKDFITYKTGIMTDKNGSIYFNWSEGAAIPLSMDPVTLADTAVSKAEGSILQGDIDAARAVIDELPDSQDKALLRERIDMVQSIADLDADVDALDQSLQQYKQELKQSDLSIMGEEGRDVLQAQLQAPYDVVYASCEGVLNTAGGIQVPEDKTALISKMTEIEGRIDVISGTLSSIQAIIDSLDKNDNYANGRSKEIRIKSDESVDLAGLFADTLAGTIGLDNISWISYDRSRVDVDENGIATPMHIYSGPVKITAYNQNGCFDIYLVIQK